MRLGELRRILLTLIGDQAPGDLTAALDESDWQRLGAMAAQHRLEPYLHAHFERRLQGLAIPATLQQQWRAAYRANGIGVLAKRKALLDTHALLAQQGIRCVALKGAWAAWHAYPAPAERPMRDVDLLVAEDEALAAFALLLANGYRQEEASARTPEQSLAYDKHLPPLLAPDGIRIELHMRLWEQPEAIGWPMPANQSAAMLARAAPVRDDTVRDDPVNYLSAEDRLVHCVIHGAYSNRLNGGPLTLLDIAAMVEQGGIDWGRFWLRAESEGWARGAGLLFHLTEQFCRKGMVAETGCPVQIEPEVWESAPDLLLQDLDARKAVGMVAGVASRMRQQGLRGAAASLVGKARGLERPRHGPDTISESGEGFGRWAVRRMGETASALLTRDVRRQARGTNRLGAWLDASR
jgi:hypothetical protein